MKAPHPSPKTTILNLIEVDRAGMEGMDIRVLKK